MTLDCFQSILLFWLESAISMTWASSGLSRAHESFVASALIFSVLIRMQGGRGESLIFFGE